MDSYSFEYKGNKYTVGLSLGLTRPEMHGGPSPYPRFEAACAEILRLADLAEARRVYIESFEPQAVATGEENQRLREALQAERDMRIAAEDRCAALIEADSAIANETIADARLGRELCAILKGVRFERGDADESWAQALRRVIDERQTLTNTVNLYRATVLKPLEREQRGGESLEETLVRIIRERDERVEPQRVADMEAKLAVASRKLRRVSFALEGRPLPEEEHGRSLLALLDSEDVPLAMAVAAYGHQFSSRDSLRRGSIVEGAWRWLREQVADPQSSSS